MNDPTNRDIQDMPKPYFAYPDGEPLEMTWMPTVQETHEYARDMALKERRPWKVAEVGKITVYSPKGEVFGVTI